MTRMFLLAALALAACGVPDEGPLMDPGVDCMSCHANGKAATDVPWTVAGTVFKAADAKTTAGQSLAEVLVTDANGKTFTLRTSLAGNFYTAEPLAFPIHVEVQKGTTRMKMEREVPVGACNACHTSPGVNDAPGRIFVP